MSSSEDDVPLSRLLSNKKKRNKVGKHPCSAKTKKRTTRQSSPTGSEKKCKMVNRQARRLIPIAEVVQDPPTKTVAGIATQETGTSTSTAIETVPAATKTHGTPPGISSKEKNCLPLTLQRTRQATRTANTAARETNTTTSAVNTTATVASSTTSTRTLSQCSTETESSEPDTEKEKNSIFKPVIIDDIDEVLCDAKVSEDTPLSDRDYDLIANECQDIFENGYTNETQKMYQRYQELWFVYRDSMIVSPSLRNEYNDVLLRSFFKTMRKKYSPSTLWVLFSCVNRYFVDQYGVKLNSLPRLKAYLKVVTQKYVTKKSKTFDSEQMHAIFSYGMQHKEDKKIFNACIGMMLMYYGLLRICDVKKITKQDVSLNADNKYEVRFEHARKRKNEGFTFIIPSIYTDYLDTYISELDPRDKVSQQFLKNWNCRSQCRIQNTGRNTISQYCKVACTTILKIDSDGYTPHCFRRSAATNLADAGVGFINLKRHGQWTSDASAERYIANSKPLRVEREQKLLPENLREKPSVNTTDHHINVILHVDQNVIRGGNVNQNNHDNPDYPAKDNNHTLVNSSCSSARRTTKVKDIIRRGEEEDNMLEMKVDPKKLTFVDNQNNESKIPPFFSSIHELDESPTFMGFSQFEGDMTDKEYEFHDTPSGIPHVRIVSSQKQNTPVKDNTHQINQLRTYNEQVSVHEVGLSDKPEVSNKPRSIVAVNSGHGHATSNRNVETLGHEIAASILTSMNDGKNGMTTFNNCSFHFSPTSR